MEKIKIKAYNVAQKLIWISAFKNEQKEINILRNITNIPQQFTQTTTDNVYFLLKVRIYQIK